MSQPNPSSIPRDNPVQRLQELLKSQLPPRPFWDRCLQDFVKFFRAEVGILWWVKADNDSLGISSICGRKELHRLVSQRSPESVAHVFQAVARQSPTRSRMVAEATQPLPKFHLISLPVRESQKVAGAIELIFSEGLSDQDVQQLLESIQHAVSQVEHARFNLSEEQTAQPVPEFWLELEKVTYRLHRSTTVRDVADIAVNDTLTLIPCDRISIGLRRGNQVRILAVGGQDHVNWRSEQVRSLTSLAKIAIESVKVLDLHDGVASDTSDISEQFVYHIEQTGCRQFLAVPLRTPSDVTNPQSVEDDTEPEPHGAIGCLIFEQFHESQTLNPNRPGFYELCDHVALSLFNALENEKIFLRPTRRLLGRTVNYFRGRRLALACLILSALLTVCIALAVITAPYRVEAEGRLMPVVQRQVFAPWDGVVVDVPDLDGLRVKSGDILVQIRNDELHAELVAIQNELNEKRQALLSYDAQIGEAAGTGDRNGAIRLRGQREETRAEISGLEEQLNVLSEREQSLTIKAPIDGIVASFQIREKLQDRPVSRGELLLEVMDDASSQWRLELQVPENRMGHLMQAFSSEKNVNLPVEYVLATDAEKTFMAELTRDAIATRSEIARESGTIVQVHASIPPETLATHRVGAQATGKIDCGQKSLAYVLFGDVWEFLLRFFWL